MRVTVGDEVKILCQVKEDGQPVSNAAISWSSANPAVANVVRTTSEYVIVKGYLEGVSRFIASCGSVQDSTEVVVEAKTATATNTTGKKAASPKSLFDILRGK